MLSTLIVMLGQEILYNWKQVIHIGSFVIWNVQVSNTLKAIQLNCPSYKTFMFTWINIVKSEKQRLPIHYYCWLNYFFLLNDSRLYIYIDNGVQGSINSVLSQKNLHNLVFPSINNLEYKSTYMIFFFEYMGFLTNWIFHFKCIKSHVEII